MIHADLPLARRSVVIACSEMKAQKLAAGIESLGAGVLLLPVVEIRSLHDQSALDAALDSLPLYSWVIFTSGYGVRFFLERMSERRLAHNLLNRLRICAVGPATAELLENAGIHVSLIPGDHQAEGILSALATAHGGLQALAGARILLPRAKNSRDLIPRKLAEAGVLLDDVPCYENVIPTPDTECIQAILDHPPDLLVFTSSSAVDHFVSMLGSDTATSLLASAKVAAIGLITSGTLARYGKQAEICPASSTIPALLDEIRLHYRAATADK